MTDSPILTSFESLEEAFALLDAGGCSDVADIAVEAVLVGGWWHGASCGRSLAAGRRCDGEAVSQPQPQPLRRCTRAHLPCLGELLPFVERVQLKFAAQVALVLRELRAGPRGDWVRVAVEASAVAGRLRALGDTAPAGVGGVLEVAHLRVRACQEAVRSEIGDEPLRHIVLAGEAATRSGPNVPCGAPELATQVSSWARWHLQRLQEKLWRTYLAMRAEGWNGPAIRRNLEFVVANYRRGCEKRRRRQPVWWPEVALDVDEALIESWDALLLGAGVGPLMTVRLTAAASHGLGWPGHPLPSLLPALPLNDRDWLVAGVPERLATWLDRSTADWARLGEGVPDDSAVVLELAFNLVGGETLSWPEALEAARALVVAAPRAHGGLESVRPVCADGHVGDHVRGETTPLLVAAAR